MKKLFVLMFVLFIGCSILQAQDEAPKSKTTYERFLSNAGKMITKDYYTVTTINSTYKNIECKAVILVQSERKKSGFFVLSADAKYGAKTAAISFDDLSEISKALTSIIETSKKSSTKNVEYREVYFSTDDGFKIGYFQRETEQTFFIEFAKYQSDDTYFFDDFLSLNKAIKIGIHTIQKYIK